MARFVEKGGGLLLVFAIGCGSAATAGSDAGGGHGGSTATGGKLGSGGATATGGKLGSGGATGSGHAHGGKLGTGGATATGGKIGTGGATGGSRDGGTDSATTAVWRPFNDSSPWNTPIAANPSIDPNSATMIADFSTVPGQTFLWINIQNYSVPLYFVDSKTTSSVTVTASLGGTGFRMGAADDSVAGGKGPAPIPAGAMPSAGSDKHLAIIDRALAIEWGFWDADNSSGSWTAGEASTMDLSGDGVRTPTNNDPWWAGHGPRACGFPLVAGLITADEIRAGAIEHALVLAHPHIRSRYYTPPASTAQGTTTDAISTRGILCGGRVQLDPTLDVTTLGLTPAGVTIARALQKYGAYLGDYSGSVSLAADASAAAMTYWNSGSGVLSNSAAEPIPLNRFRVLTIGTTYDNMN